MHKVLKTLIVDDDEVDRRTIKRLVPRTGLSCQIDEVCDGEAALARVSAEHYDCVFLDHRLPDQTGVDLLPKLRACHHGELPIVMLTGSGDERLAVASLQRGAQHYLSKQALDADSLRQAIEMAIERAAEAESLKRLSFYDSVTGLANRHLFEDRIAQTARTAERTGRDAAFALLYMDLDRFKRVNDVHGHAAGDHVLLTVAKRLSRSMRESDTLARLGGDEFGAILATTGSLHGAVSVARKLEEALRAPIAWEDELLEVGLSIGIAMYPEDAADVATLMHHADEAMYRAKRGGHGYAAYAEPAPASPCASPRATGAAHCASQPRLSLVFQPKQHLKTGALHGVETLIEWPHPALGTLPARALIPATDSPETARSLSYAVLEGAVRQARRWSVAGIEIPVAANVPPRLLSDPNFPDNLAALLDTHDLQPAGLMLEVAETDVLDQPQAARETLERILELGVQLAIDSFGTACAPFDYLGGLPIAEVKIDRAFVQDLVLNPDGSSVVASVTRHAERLGASVVAEGVDSAAARTLLLSAGCSIGQGLACSAPLRARAVIEAYEPSRRTVVSAEVCVR